MTRGFELVTRRFDLVTRRFELVTPGFELVTPGFELVTPGFEIVTRVYFSTLKMLIFKKVLNKFEQNFRGWKKLIVFI